MRRKPVSNGNDIDFRLRSQLYEAAEDIGTNGSENPTMGEIIEQLWLILSFKQKKRSPRQVATPRRHLTLLRLQRVRTKIIMLPLAMTPMCSYAGETL
jgi:hypothetical protein